MIAVPLALSFDRKTAFVRRWPRLLPAIVLSGTAFLAWDVAFASAGVWSFNEHWLVGVEWLGLPVEEWLFFLVVPYACLFVFACLEARLPRFDPLHRAAPAVAAALGVGCALIALLHLDLVYTATAFGLAAFLLLVVAVLRPPWAGRFLSAGAICLVPFVIVNGLLTGTFLPEPMVIDDDSANLGLRLGTIPVEDAAYMLLLLPAFLWRGSPFSFSVPEPLPR